LAAVLSSVCCGLLLLACAPDQASGPASPSPQLLQDAAPPNPQTAVLKTRRRLNEQQATELAGRLGLQLIHAFHYQNLVLVAGTFDEAAILSAGGPDVIGISRGASVRGGSDLRTWGHLAKPRGSQVVFVSQSASGVRIGLVDSGLDCAHPDFLYTGSTTCVVGRSYSFVNYEPNPYQDLGGHGTSVASVGAARVNGTHLFGAAPDV